MGSDGEMLLVEPKQGPPRLLDHACWGGGRRRGLIRRRAEARSR